MAFTAESPSTQGQQSRRCLELPRDSGEVFTTLVPQVFIKIVDVPYPLISVVPKSRPLFHEPTKFHEPNPYHTLYCTVMDFARVCDPFHDQSVDARELSRTAQKHPVGLRISSSCGMSLYSLRLRSSSRHCNTYLVQGTTVANVVLQQKTMEHSGGSVPCSTQAGHAAPDHVGKVLFHINLKYLQYQ